jgi:hypothetical protein
MCYLSVCLCLTHLELSPSPSVDQQVESLFVPPIVTHEGGYKAILLDVSPVTGKAGQGTREHVMRDRIGQELS